MKAKQMSRFLALLLAVSMLLPMVVIPTFAEDTLTTGEGTKAYLYENTFETYEEGHVWNSSDDYFSTNPNAKLASSARKHTVVKNPDGSDDLVWQMPLISADDAGNGRNKYLNVPVLSYQTTPKLVLSMDIYIPDGASGIYLIEGIGATYDTNKSGNPSMFVIYIDSPTAAPYLQTRANSGDLQKNHPLERNKWYTLEYALNLVTGEWKFYIDGAFWTSELRYSFFKNVTLQTYGINTWGGTLAGSIYMDDIRVFEDNGYYFPMYENTFEGYTVGSAMADTAANGFAADLTSLGYTVAQDPQNADNNVLSVPVTDTAADNYKAATREHSTPSDYRNAMEYITFEEDILIPSAAVGCAKIQGFERYYSTGNGWRDFFYIDFTATGAATIVLPSGNYEVKGGNLKLNRDTWYTLTVSVNQVTGDYTVLVDGEVVLVKNIGSTYLNLCQFFIARIKKAADCGATLNGAIYVDNVRICKGYFKEGRATANRTYKWSNDFEAYTADTLITDTSAASGFDSGLSTKYGCTTVYDPLSPLNKVMSVPVESGDNYVGATYDFRNYSALSSMTRMVYEQDLYFPSATTGKTRVQGWKAGDSADGGGFFNFYEIDFSEAGKDVTILPAGSSTYKGELTLKRNTWYTVTFSVDQTTGAYYLLVDGIVAAIGAITVTAPRYAQFFFLRCYSGASGIVYIDNMHIYEGYDTGSMTDTALYRNNFESYSNGFVWSAADAYFASNPNKPITDGSLPHKVAVDPEDGNNLAWQIPLTSANLNNNQVYLSKSSAVSYQTTPLVTLSMNVYVPTGAKGDVKMQGHSDAQGFNDLYHILMKGTSASVWVDDTVAYTGDLSLRLDAWHTIDYSLHLVTGEFKLMIDGNIAYAGNIGLTDRAWDGWIIAKLQSTDRVSDCNGTMLIDDLVITPELVEGSMASTSYLYENHMEQYWSGHVLGGDAWFNANINDGNHGHVIVTDPANVANKVWKIPTGSENANNTNSSLKIDNNVIAYNKTRHIVFETDLYIPMGTTGTFLMEAWSRDHSDSFQYFYQVDVTSVRAEITPYGEYSYAGDNLALTRDTWHKVAFALDMVTGGYTIYVDGAVAAIGITGQTNLLVSNDSFMIAKMESSRTGTGYVLIDDILIYEGEEPMNTVIGESTTEDFSDLPTGVYDPAVGTSDSMAHSTYSYAVHGSIVLQAEYYVGNDASGILESKFDSYRYLVSSIWGIGKELSLYSIDLASGRIYQKNHPEIYGTLNLGEVNNVAVVLDLTTGKYSVYINGIGAFNADVGKTNLTLGAMPAQYWQFATVASDEIIGDITVDNLVTRLLEADDLITIATDSAQTLKYIDVTVGDVSVRTGVTSLLLPANTSYAATPVYFDADSYDGLLTTEQKVSMRLKEKSGLRFATTINDMETFDALFASVGTEIGGVYFGTLITPANYLEAVSNVFTKASLGGLFGADSEKTVYLDVRATHGFYIAEGVFDNDPATTHFVGSIVNLHKENYNRSFAAIGYLEIVLLTGEVVTLYSPQWHTANVRTVANVLRSAGDGYYDGLSDTFKSVVDGFADYTSSVETVEDTVPTFTTVGTVSGSYLTEKGESYTVYAGVSDAEIEAYCAELLANGFTLYTSNVLDNNSFATYIGNTTSVRLFHYSAQTDNFRILVSGLDNLSDTEMPVYEEIEGLVPTVTQLERNGVKQGSTGQSHVIQLADGSFAIVDGGPRDEEDAYHLLQYLYSNKPATDAKPRVTWFFTHAHDDHITLALDFMEAYHALIELETVAYNFPDYDGAFTATNEGNANADGYQKRLNTILKRYYSSTVERVFHTGDKIYLPGCVVDILHTYLDLYTETAFAGINETSSVLKMTFDSGYRLLITGDMYPSNCNWLIASYPEALAADIVQTPHHGRDGANAEFYHAVLGDLKILLWTNSASFMESRSGSANDAYDWSHNATVLASETVVHYHSSVTVIINMKDLSVAVDDTE